MNFLCPACRTPLPAATPAVVACTQCGVEVDLTRVDTAPGQAKLWPEVDLAGESLGAFKLLSRAGSGGMGTVYVAEGLTGRCAVKVLSPQLAADPSLRERFRREAEALRNITHPNIVRVIAEGAENGFCWYAMEHVEGKDLRARIAEGPLPALEVEALARQLLDALAAVHDGKLIHRDLKPGNILLSSTGARLCDFGIARFDGATTLTESAALLGSLRYMAPEQRAGVTTPKSDLYSLGLVLYEAVTGGLPGEKDAPGGRLGKLIEALLQTSPAKRPADARAAAKLIAPRSLKGVGTAALFASSLLGVAAFSAWAILASQAGGPTKSARELKDPAPAVAKATSVPIDAGAALAEATPASDAGAAPVELSAVPTKEPLDTLRGKPTKPSKAPLAEPAQRVPKVSAAVPFAKGIDLDLADALLRKHEAEVRVCYEDALKADPAVEGTIALSVVVQAPRAGGRHGGLLRPMVLGAGKKAPPSKIVPLESKTAPVPAPLVPLRVTLAKSTVKNAQLEKCLLGAVQGWEWPTDVSGTAMLAWSFSQVALDDVRAEADRRADTGLTDPREPLSTAPPPKPKGKPMPVKRKSATEPLLEPDPGTSSKK